MDRKNHRTYLTHREKARINTLVHRGWFSGCFAAIQDEPCDWRGHFAAQKELVEATDELIPIGQITTADAAEILSIYGPKPTAQP